MLSSIRSLTIDATSAIVVALAFSAEQAKHLRIPRGFGYLVPQAPSRGRDLKMIPSC